MNLHRPAGPPRLDSLALCAWAMVAAGATVALAALDELAATHDAPTPWLFVILWTGLAMLFGGAGASVLLAAHGRRR